MAEGQIKSFVTGDAMEFEQKFKHPFRLTDGPKLVLATNNPPTFSDKSDGVWRSACSCCRSRCRSLKPNASPAWTRRSSGSGPASCRGC